MSFQSRRKRSREMELTIDREELMEGLARVHGVADRKSSMPVLANVLLETEGPGGLRISATDLHMGITGVVPAQVVQGGSTTASARTMFDIVRNLPNGEVHLVVDQNQWLEVRCGRVRYRIAGIPAEDFPELPSSEDVEFFCLDAVMLGRMIERTAFAVSPDEGRPHLNGALFEGGDRKLLMVATDGHRLSLVDQVVERDGGIASFSMLVPLKAIHELRRMLEEGPGDVEIGAYGPNAFFRRHLAGAGEGVETEVTMNVKLVDARFPPYQKVIPASSQYSIAVDRTALLEALRRTALISHDKSVALRIIFRGNGLTVTSDNPDVGEAREEVDAQYDGNEQTMGFNGRYLMDVLSALDCDAVRLAISGPTDACVITPVEGDGYLGVVMPMRL
jgi:DNA polymerase-3 subunit beta